MCTAVPREGIKREGLLPGIGYFIVSRAGALRQMFLSSLQAGSNKIPRSRKLVAEFAKIVYHAIARDFIAARAARLYFSPFRHLPEFSSYFPIQCARGDFLSLFILAGYDARVWIWSTSSGAFDMGTEILFIRLKVADTSKISKTFLLEEFILLVAALMYHEENSRLIQGKVLKYGFWHRFCLMRHIWYVLSETASRETI